MTIPAIGPSLLVAALHLDVAKVADFVEKTVYYDARGSLVQSLREAGLKITMGHRQVDQAAFFCEFSLQTYAPPDHLLRTIDKFVEFGELRRELARFYSTTGRPSVDPELMIRMLIVGYCFGIRSERRLCEEVRLNLAYRWLCRRGLDGAVPDHSTFSTNRHGRICESDLLRRVFEMNSFSQQPPRTYAN